MILGRFSRRQFLGSSVAAATASVLAGAAQGAPAAEVPWLAEVQRIPEHLSADAPRLMPVHLEQGRPLGDLAAWERNRAGLRQAWLDFLRPFAEHKAPPRVEVLEEGRSAGVVRQLVRYEVEPGLATEAYLLRRGERHEGVVPGVVVLHPTVGQSIREPAGVEGQPNMAFGLRMAQAGCVAICPRNFLWTENRKMDIPRELSRFQSRHPGSKGMAKMLFDAQVALDILVAQPGVDPKRLGAIGHSLGGKEVLYLAALDERVRVAISSEGGIGTKFSNWADPWYLGGEIRNATFAHEHHELLAMVAPRAFLLLGGDSADGERSWPFIQAALPVYEHYGKPARVGLFNHRQGHSVPPQAERRIDEWFAAYL